MKKVIASLVLFSLLLLGVSKRSNAQVIIKVKPYSKQVTVVKPVKKRPHYLWVNPHWKWNKSTHMYVWVKGHYAQKRRGYNYAQGYWVNVPNKGYYWKKGKWVRA